MTEEEYQNAKTIQKSLNMLKEVKKEMDRNRWVHFHTAVTGHIEYGYDSSVLRKDLKNFIDAEIEKFQKMFDEA